MVRRLLPSADRRAVGPFVFFDHFGPIDVAAGRQPRRPAASAHRPGDADLPVRRRDHASRLDRRRPADRARRGQLDVGRARHRPLRAHAQGAASAALTAATACSSGSRCPRRDEDVGAVVPARRRPSASRASGSTARRRTSSSARRSAPPRRSRPRRRRWPSCSTSTSRSGTTVALPAADATERALYALDHPIEVDGVKVDECTMVVLAPGHDADARGAARRPRRPRRRRAARPPLPVVELRRQPARADPRRRGRLARAALRRGSPARPSSSRFRRGGRAPAGRPDRAGTQHERVAGDRERRAERR